MDLSEISEDLSALGVDVVNASNEQLVAACSQLIALTRTVTVDYFATYRTIGDALTSIEAGKVTAGEKDLDAAMADVDEILAAIVEMMTPTIYHTMLSQYGAADGSAGGVPISNPGFSFKLQVAKSNIAKLSDEHIAAIEAYGSRTVTKYPGLRVGHLLRYVSIIREAE